ncbi:MAG: DNA topoisomerase I [Anaerolineaceae bacterium 4572_78]|nr:MAG: DNA topoisomerase I [Anaerolineaceae bacterium 4572_78]
MVESPAKARTISKFLGRGYVVKASVGHVRDLLRSKLSVDVENDFAPTYRVPNEKRELVKELKEDVADATEVYLATDSDREGEAIAWHLMESTNMDAAHTQRVIFHEITRQAISHAFDNPCNLDMNRVNAQQARRILDRLVGYKISPLLWRRVQSRTSAGRVQSVALRLICEREVKIDEFVSVEYWTIKSKFSKQAPKLSAKEREFIARLIKIDGHDVDLHNGDEVEKVVASMAQQLYHVIEVKHGQRRRNPFAPFITSTLQQEASRRLGFRTKKTMKIAQRLYEGTKLQSGETVGLITYMRTDSTQVSNQAQTEARKLITQQYGSEFVPPKPPVYKKKSRGAQEAHEAIRPTSVWRSPNEIKSSLGHDEYKLYNLIWQRFVASQMAHAVYQTSRLDLVGGQYELRASGSQLKFAGFLSVYKDIPSNKWKTNDDMGTTMPDMVKGENVDLVDVLPEQHFTQPPPRYTEASLVKTLEEHGIGRPSTYVPTINTIQERGYVELSEKLMYPTELGTIVNELVVEYFPNVISVDFTAQMEEDLDKIAWGEKEWVPILHEFYTPFEKAVKIAEEKMPEMKVTDTLFGEKCEKCGHELVIKTGRFGKFIACSNFPECRYTRPFVQKLGMTCPKCEQGDVVGRRTKKGRVFYGCNRYPDCDWTSWKKPLTTPCPHCGGLLVTKSKQIAQCVKCEKQVDIRALNDKVPTAK